MASSGEISNVARLELLVHEDKLPQQAIGYMENIDFHPTLLDVTQQIMVLEVCGKKICYCYCYSQACTQN